MIHPVSNEDIKASLWSLKAFKALGPNGLHAGFLHRFWLLVGDSVKEEVKGIFSLGKIPEYLNQTIITLVPKCKNPDSWCPLYKLLLFLAKKELITPL